MPAVFCQSRQGRFGALATRLRPLAKMGAPFFFLVALFVFVRVFGWARVLTPAWADTYLKAGNGGIGLYFAAVAVLSPLGVPRQLLSALGGYAFGAFFGVLWSSAGLMAGCAAGFFFSRLLARAMVQRRFGARIGRLNAFLSRNPFAMAVAIRCFPIGNNALTSLIAGVTSIPALPFITGSGVGYLPQTIVFSLLGSGVNVSPAFRLALSVLLFAVATWLGILLHKKFRGERILREESGTRDACLRAGESTQG